MSDQRGDARFDPRHDPIYQRGYEQSAAQTPVARQPETRPAPVPQPLPQSAGQPGATDAVDRPALDADPTFDGGEHLPAGAESVRNPYFLALWIVAIVFILAGVALEWRSVVLADYGYSSPGTVTLEAVIQQLTWTIAPIMIGVGALTIVALLFWQGMHWRPSRRDPSRWAEGERKQPRWKPGQWS